MFNNKLDLALREIEKVGVLNESKEYTEEQLIDIILKNPKKEKNLSKDRRYAKIIKRLKEGGLI